jgi:hypothetical protein
MKAQTPTIPEFNELMIGNLVFDDEHNIVEVYNLPGEKEGKFVKVRQKKGKINTIYCSNIHKIPLTVKWLMALKFKKLDNWFVYEVEPCISIVLLPAPKHPQFHINYDGRFFPLPTKLFVSDVQNMLNVLNPKS